MTSPPPPPANTPSTEAPPLPGNEPDDPGPMEHLVPTRNVSALLSWYLGVFGLIPVLGIPLALAAIVTGIMGIRAAGRTDVRVGRGHAIAGLVLGILMGVLVPVALFTLTYSFSMFD